MTSQMMNLVFLPLLLACGGSEAPPAAPDAAAKPTEAPVAGAPADAGTLRFRASTFSFGKDAASLPTGFTPNTTAEDGAVSACAPGAENSLCGILRNGKLTAVELIHSGTDGTYGCDTAPAFVQEAVALLEAAGIPKPKSIFGEFGLVEGTFDAAKATSTRRIAGPTWTAAIEVWQDHDSIPLSCTLRVTQTLPRP